MRDAGRLQSPADQSPRPGGHLPLEVGVVDVRVDPVRRTFTVLVRGVQGDIGRERVAALAPGLHGRRVIHRGHGQGREELGRVPVVSGAAERAGDE